MLFRVAPGDPLSVAVAVGTLLTTTLAAAYIPAHRAAGINPAMVLREE
jgi:ABC-type lipoprotein release transport system permease subunit